MTNDYLELTYNLRSIIESMERSVQAQFEVAFMNVVDREEKNLLSYLKRETEQAIKSNEEFNIPFFSKPLLEAINTTDIISIIPNRSLETVLVFINMNEYAGEYEDYGNAVRQARIAGGFGLGDDPRKASQLWKDIVYSPARLGTTGNPDLYWQTLQLRKEFYRSKAPYWYILEYGNAPLGSSNRGGTPFPEAQPTRFISTAEFKMESFINKELKSELDRVLGTLREEIGKAYDILQEVSRVVTDEKYKTPRYREPQIIKEYEILQRRYKLYITRTGKLGFSLRPEI